MLPAKKKKRSAVLPVTGQKGGKVLKRGECPENTRHFHGLFLGNTQNKGERASKKIGV